jgi:hypothetical protein
MATAASRDAGALAVTPARYSTFAITAPAGGTGPRSTASTLDEV